MTRDVITTLGLLLGAALAARFVAGLLKVPEMLVLVAVGVLLSGVVDVPLDSTGAQLLFTLGVSMILFYGGLNLSLAVLRRVWVSLSLLVVPGVVLTAVVTGVAAYAVFDLSWTAGIAGGLLLAVTISSRRIGIWDESAGLAVLAVVAIGYVSLDSAGGSGYLGAFLAGLIVGNMEHLRLGMHSEHEEDMRRFASNLSDLATLLVFVVLGANIPLDDLADHLLPAPGRAGDAAARRPAADGPRLRAARSRRWLDVARDRVPVLDARDRRRAGRAGRRDRRPRRAERGYLRERRRAGDRGDAGAPGAAGAVAGEAVGAARRRGQYSCR